MPSIVSFRCVPPSPDVMAALYMDYTRNGKPVGMSFAQYLRAVGYNDPSAQIDGMDDGLRRRPDADASGPELISVPSTPVTGVLRLIVLLVDFSDNVGVRPPVAFRDLLFSSDTFPTGSMRDYYREVSGGKVQVEGTVHGWFRLPQPYTFYTNNESGMGRDQFDDSYPNNARRMAEDAVAAAKASGVVFDPALDKFGDGTITALFIVHAGRGAEELSPAIRNRHIWSHKWELRNTSPVSAPGQPALEATRYLTVPEDCNMGVCAHELGHLAFQWEDFYDPDGGDNGQWAGSGNWDLMGGGSWNGNRGDTPAHPAGLHKLQHGWVTAQRVVATTAGVVLPPFSATGGSVVIVRGPGYGPNQSLVLENRLRANFDRKLPGGGLLVWRFDQDREQVGPIRPALQLVQADGLGDLEASFGGNQGDAGDPFPGTTAQTSVDDGLGVIRTTSFRERRSGVTLSHIVLDPVTQNITLTITVATAPHAAPSAAALEGAYTQPSEAVAGVDRLLSQEKVPAEELRRMLSDATPSLVDIEAQARRALEAPGVAEAAAAMEPPPPKKSKGGKTAKAKPPKLTARGMAAALTSSRADDFNTLLFRAFKRLNGITWDREGTFFGALDRAVHLIDKGDGNFDYTPDADDPFGYETADGQRITPGAMVTDAGSIPPLAHQIEGLDPFTFLKAYLIHDWEFMVHHCHRPSDGRSFEEVNHTLAEGVYTLMVTEDNVPSDWRKVVLIHAGVSSFVGRRVWDKQWSVPECVVALPGFGSP